MNSFRYQLVAIIRQIRQYNGLVLFFCAGINDLRQFPHDPWGGIQIPVDGWYFCV
jgi:hypothetical protein